MEVIKKSKGEQTRALILETALRLFRERGFEETTMRVIADEAGVALGSTYYYFSSKNELILDFYERMQAAQFAAGEGILLTEKSLKGRITGSLRTQMAIMAPYQRLFLALFKVGADPESTVSPFSSATQKTRDAAIKRCEEIVTGAQERIPDDMAQELPMLLWLYQLSIVLFWIYDRSPHFVRTYKLIELSSDIICNLINLAGMPLMQPLRKSMLNTLNAIKEV